VAVKKLQSHWLESDPTAAADFDQEARFLRSIRHPNVVHFFGAGKLEASGIPFLVTEFVSRGSLFLLLRDVPDQITLQRKLNFMIDVATGMTFLVSSSVSVFSPLPL
jgi:serine/threonine protein kinase